MTSVISTFGDDIFLEIAMDFPLDPGAGAVFRLFVISDSLVALLLPLLRHGQQQAPMMMTTTTTTTIIDSG